MDTGAGFISRVARIIHRYGIKARFILSKPGLGGRGSGLTARGLCAKCNAGLGCQRSSVG